MNWYRGCGQVQTAAVARGEGVGHARRAQPAHAHTAVGAPRPRMRGCLRMRRQHGRVVVVPDVPLQLLVLIGPNEVLAKSINGGTDSKKKITKTDRSIFFLAIRMYNIFPRFSDFA